MLRECQYEQAQETVFKNQWADTGRQTDDIRIFSIGWLAYRLRDKYLTYTHMYAYSYISIWRVDIERQGRIAYGVSLQASSSW